jgi:hypothetical protein
VVSADHASDPGRGDAPGQLQKGQRAQNYSHLLDSAAHQLSKFFLIPDRYLNAQGWTSHTLSMSHNIFDGKCFIAKSSRGHRPRDYSRNPRCSRGFRLPRRTRLIGQKRPTLPVRPPAPSLDVLILNSLEISLVV